MKTLIKQAQKSGVHLYLKEGQLAFKLRKGGQLSEQLKSEIRSSKSELIAFLQNSEGQTAHTKNEQIVRIDRAANAFPLSHSQQSLWTIDNIEGGSAAYNLPFTWHVKGDFKLAAAEQALRLLIERHETLRTIYLNGKNGPTQLIKNDFEFQIQHLDFVGLSEAEIQVRSQRVIDEFSTYKFDLSCELMLKACFIALPRESDHKQGLFLLNIHHIAADGWSLQILINEFCELYQTIINSQPNPFPRLEIQYADYAVWQAKQLETDAMKLQLDYWSKKLKALPIVHSLPLDYPRKVSNEPIAKVVTGRLNKADTTALLELCKDHNVTPFIALHAALALLLSKHSNSDDVVIGSPFANRKEHALEPLVGFFVNTIILRVNTTGSLFSDYLQHVRQVNLEAQRNQDVSFGQLLDLVNVERSSLHAPLFQIMFSMDTNEQPYFTIDEVNFSAVDDKVEFAKFDLDISAEITDSGLKFDWIYNSELFSEQHISQLSSHLLTLLKNLCKGFDVELQKLSLCSESERQAQISTLQDSPFTRSSVSFIDEQYQSLAKQLPDAIAVTCDGHAMTYEELDKAANKVANYLISREVGKQSLVGVSLEPSLNLIIAILGVLKSGGTFVPLDANYPQQRLNHMIEDSAMTALLTQSTLVSSYTKPSGIDVIVVDDENQANQIIQCSDKAPKVEYREPNDYAYVIYTSGSTGKPKGVSISHANWLSYAEAIGKAYHIVPDDRVLQFSSISFDIFIEELSASILSGGSLVLVTKEQALTCAEFWQCIANHQISIASVPTAYWHQLSVDSQLVNDSQNTPMRLMVTGGEAMSAGSLEAWKTHAPASIRLLNTYGPTETTVIATYFDSKDYRAGSANVAIGKPLANCFLMVLDADKEPVPDGIIGELHIGGHAVSPGYLNNSEQNQKAFISNPFSNDPNDRLYCSGDLVRRLADGNIEFIGRSDDQVKLNGFRIELGEIEYQLTRHAQVASALVVINKDMPERQFLGAYVIPTHSKDVGNMHWMQQLKREMKQRLPSYMVPKVWVALDTWPLNANGKIDKKALPDLQSSVDNHAYEKPETTIQASLVEIWSKLLKLESNTISITDDFFDLGGHSLLAVRLASEVRAVLGKELSVKAIFDTPTVRELADSLEAVKQVESSARNSIMPSGDDSHALSFAQQRLWFIDQALESSTQYNMPFSFRLCGDFVPEVAERTLRIILQRHEPLRTVFSGQNGEAIFKVIDSDDFHIQIQDLTGLDGKEQQDTLAQLTHDESHYQFDLESDYMLRASIFKLAENERGLDCVLLLNMHHIASDGWSMGILLSEFSSIYQSITQSTTSILPKLEVTYRDFAYWQQNQFQGEFLNDQLEYWDKQLAEVPALHGLPLDHPRKPSKGSNANIVHKMLQPALSKRVDELAKAKRMTSFMILHGVFALLLSRHSNSNDIVIGTPVANRVQAELENLIGCFVNTVALRVCTDFDCIDTYLEHVKQVNLDAQLNQDVPFEKVVEKCKVARSNQYSPLFQIMFSMDNNAVEPFQIQGVDIKELDWVDITSKFDLDVSVEIISGVISISWVYDADIFEHKTVERLSEHYVNLLTELLNASNSQFKSLSMLSASEISTQLSQDVNNIACYQSDQLLHKSFSYHAGLTPNLVALKCNGMTLTFKELDERSNALAHFLLDHGLQPSELVVISMPRSAEMIVGILAILKAGGAYIPLDPKLPKARQDYVVEDSQTNIILTHSTLADMFSDQEAICIEVDSIAARLEEYPTQEPVVQGLNSEQLAYMIYTSGSTGKPKGVLISHRCVMNLAYALQELSFGKTWGWLASFVFDASVQGLSQLFLGQPLSIIEDEEKRNASLLASRILSDDIGVLDCTPGLVELWLAQGSIDFLPELIIGGEAISNKLWHSLVEFQSSTDNRAFNVYGPTECTVDSTWTLIEGTEPHIGYMLPNTQGYILDESMNLLPKGAVGELWIGGAGLAKGYHRKPEMTAEKFRNIRLEDGKERRLYRTSDLVYYNNNEQIVFVGRTDDQVKIHGYRIELGEIKAQIIQCAGVESALVTTYDDKSGHQALIAYVVGKQTTNRAENLNFSQEIDLHLRQNLPEYMVPASIITLDEWPLTVNGKIDQGALKNISVELNMDGYVAPTCELEKTLANIWSQLLGLDPNQLSITANFFALGGHSLLIIKLLNELNSELNEQLKIRDIFNFPTIYDLASFIKSKMSSASSVNTPFIELIPAKYELSNIFCIPGAGASSASFIHLALSLQSSFNFKSFEYDGLDGITEPHQSMAELVDDVVSALQKEQPHGPYIILGHSFGGLVGYEVVARLHQLGHSATLITLDSFLSSSPELTEASEDSIHPSLSVISVNARNVYEAHLNISNSYQPNDFLGVKLIFLYAKQSEELMRASGQFEFIEGALGGEVAKYSVTGEHYSILKDKNVYEIKLIIESELLK